MKQFIITILAIVLLVRCEKEKQLKESTEKLTAASMEAKKIPPDKVKNSNNIPGSNSPVSNFFPCDYYPPGSPFSCNPGSGTDDAPYIAYPNITYQNGYLNFNSINDFTTTYEIMDSLLENFTGYDYAMNFFGGDLDRIDSLLDVRGIDESKSLRDFENKFSGYYSLRKDVETKENTFLDGGGDPANTGNPENAHYLDDDVLRTMLNKEGVISIENVIIKIFENGVTYAILNGNTTLLNKLSHPDIYGLAPWPEYFSTHLCKIDTQNIKLISLPLYCEQPPGESLGGDDQSADDLLCGSFKTGRQSSNMGQDCKLWYRKMATVLYGNNKKEYVGKIAVYNAFFYDAGLSKIRNYKKKTNGKWKPTRANLSAYVSENGCSLYNKNKATKYRKFRRCVKRDVSIIPGVGGLFRGVRWMVENIIASANGNSYYRFFKTATNHGGFYGSNYCNGMQQIIQANW